MILPLDDHVYVGSLGKGLYILHLGEAENPPPQVSVWPPVVDAGNVFLRWHALAYQGEMNPAQIETRFRLDGGAWSRWNTVREATLPGLSSGPHTFTVQAKGLFGALDEAGASVSFNIPPPFYRHPLFLAAGFFWLMSMAGLGVLYWRKQQRMLKEIEARNRMLKGQNAELERYAYTVSHDLKTPLVTIKGFLGLLEKDALAGDMSRLRNDITVISEAANQMHRLLEDLLELSRIGRVVNPSEVIPLNDLAEEVTRLVDGAISQRGVVVSIQPSMPAVWGDRVRLLEVFQNLLDNAVRYMDAQENPRVEIEARREDGMILCRVQDNGIGIKPAYHERIFRLFERLDTDNNGTGIGLALVKRIVEMHGGRIWVESKGIGYGSTFWFTLPSSQTQADA